MSKRFRNPGVSYGIEEETRISKKKKIVRTKKRASKPAKSPSGAGESVMARRKLIVGLDYGTTYTGVAYVMSGCSDARDVKVISDWTGALRNNEELEKVPSCIAYAAENENMDMDCFGYEVESQMKSYHWTKLLLDQDGEHTEFDNPYLQTQNKDGLLKLPGGKDATDVATDVLRFVYNRAMEKFDRLYGRQVVKLTKIECWVTVPATWSERAIDSTRRAALAAGFGARPGDEISVITEPEAAAIAILSASLQNNPGLYKKATNVLICDMGGGTVDIQCLTVTKEDPLRTDEICEGQGKGGKTGSTYIDCNLHQWMKDTFRAAFISLPANKIAANSKFMLSWETIKRSFDGKNPDKEHRLSLPALRRPLEVGRVKTEAYDFEDHEVILLGADISKMFDPVIEKTIALIDSQRKMVKKTKQSPIEIIALCGGLGGSGYVWHRLQQYCSAVLDNEDEYDSAVNKNGLQLVTDARAWSSIARGAAIRGLDGNMVVSKRSKRHYGIGVHQPFETGVDREEDAFECPVGGKRADGYIKWCITKGYNFTPNLRIPTKVYVPVYDDDDEGDDLRYCWNLYSCGADKAPNREDREGIKFEAKIRLDISRSFTRPSTEHSATNGAVPAMINIVFKLGSAKGTLLVEALHQRQVVGSATLEYSKSQTSRATQSAGLLQ